MVRLKFGPQPRFVVARRASGLPARRRALVGAATLMLVAASVVAPTHSPASTTVTTFAPVADASVRVDRPTKNYGAARQLTVDAGPQWSTLFTFDVTGVGGATVSQAVLRLRVENGSPLGGDIYRLADTSWSEPAVTWDTAPPPTSSVPLASLGKVAAGTWATLDVTSAVTGDGTYGFRLESTSTNGAGYAAREAGAAVAPQLIVTVDPTGGGGPAVTLTAPWPGSAVAGDVVLAADATAAVGGAAVARVDFRVDGVVVATDPIAPWTASWNTAGSAATTHEVAAVMVDTTGNQTVSAPVTVTTPADTAPPSRPTGLVAAATGPGRVDLSWTPATDDVAVASYQVLRDGVALPDPTTSARIVDWGVTPESTYHYTVVAVDAAGQVSAASDPATVTTPAVPPGPPPVKAQAGGLFDRQGLANPAERDVVNGFVVKVAWADLQPTANGPLADGNPIDTALASARQLNAADPALELRLKLRVYAGGESPEWAKQLDGPPMTICDPAAPAVCETVPRFWTDRFRDAYQRLQDLLAARYDAALEILETVIDRCSTLFAEPMLRQAVSADNLGEYDRAGYTTDLDQRCQRQQLDAHRAWSTTRSGIALNPYQRVDTTPDPPTLKSDVGFTETIMVACRQALGPRCVLGNNSIRDRSGGPAYDRMYAAMAALGPPIYFQTATLQRVGNLGTTLSCAESQGAGMVELPEGYETALSLSQLASHDATLQSAALPSR